MDKQAIRFDDGAAYERMMGGWSRLAGEIFLDWLQPATAQSWIDVGCGNGAFTELIVERCAPRSIDGIDPSEAQLAYARQRHPAGKTSFHKGNAMSLAFEDGLFDVAVMALVLFFVPEPAKGVAEMRRVVRRGGTVATYVWDMPGGGYPYEVIMEELPAVGLSPPRPPRAEVSALAKLRELWRGAALEQVETKAISVTRTFSDFDEFWRSGLSGNVGPMVAALSSADAERLKARVMARIPAGAAGQVIRTGVANAVTGRVPA